MTETKHTFCRICEALCGLEVQVENGKITQIRPDDQHVATRGFACAKGLKQHHLYDISDRLMYPLKKVGTQHVRISWEQALLEIGTKVNQIRKLEHPNSVGMYVGTAAGFGVLHPVFAQGFMTGLGSKSMYASATQDCSNKFAVAQHVYGFPFTQPFPDIHHTECLIVVGANPVISKWSFLQVPNPAQHLKEMERRGARLFFVDPRRTESAKVAGEHVFIRPGTDVFFYLSFLHELIHTGGVEADRVARFMKGYENIQELAQAWPPERTAPITHIVPEKLREMVKAYREANGAAFYSSTGVNMGGNGTLAFWIQEIINAISGNLDRRGGTLVGKGVIDFPKFGRKRGLLMQDERSRIGNLTKVNDAFAGGVMADEILTPGPRQLKALFVTGGNPLITMANANRLREAFSKLELLVCLDIQMSETASMAHYVLPCTSPLQRPDLPFIFPLMLGLQVKPYLQATKAVVAPEGEQRDEATIYLDLARACGVSIFGSAVAQRTLELSRKLKRTKAPNGQPLLPQEGLLNFLLRITGQKGFKKLLKHPHGLPRPAHQPGSFLGQRVTTEDAKIDLAPAILQQEAQKLEAAFARELALKDHLKLITKRAVTTHNSWTHNFEGFVQGERQTNYLYMHPEDAQKRGLADGDTVDVRSQTATVRLPLKLLPDLMPGTVALPHGWGHQASKMQTARRTKGVNVNILAADGPDKIDPVSGMAHLTGIPVEVFRAAGPQAENSWSGLPEDVWQDQD
ncbi:MAG: molybdopterin-dependent oxidoreductase [Microscillaceae bacterium]|nr:molybdopterin-dependent oxidoreductase [Microscillaceae bacterium]